MGIFTIYQTFISVSIGLAIIFFVGGESFVELITGFQQVSLNLNNALTGK